MKKDWNPKPGTAFPMTKFGSKNRCFQPKWLTEYPGLVYSPKVDGVFCVFCLVFPCDSDSKRGAMVKSAYKNWKHAKEKFNEHFLGKRGSKSDGGAGYQVHLDSRQRAEHFIASMEKNTNVVLQMNNALRKRQENNMTILESIVKTVILCGRQNVSLRGDRDDSQYLGDPTINCGNFQAFLDYRIDGGDRVLQKHFETAPLNATYRSKTIQNEIINIIGSMIQNIIVSDIKKTGGWFSISADEVRDISNKEQLAICARYPDENGRALDVINAMGEVSAITDTLKVRRENVDSFSEELFAEAVKLGDKVDVEPSIPRLCGRQTKRANTPAASPEEYYRRTLVIPFLDHLNQQMAERFSELNRKATMALQLLPPVKETTNAETLSFFVDDLPSPATLEQEVDIWRRKWTGHPSPPQTLEEALKSCDDGLYPNVKTVLKIASTFPVTSCECERSISTLGLVKTKLRSTMGQERLTGLCLLSRHRDIKVDAREVVLKFARMHPRRMTFPNVLADSE